MSLSRRYDCVSEPSLNLPSIIVVSGLSGHAFGSFKDRGGTHMWLLDSLPYDLTRDDTKRSMARVMLYGHKSTVAESDSMQNLDDLAISFRDSLLPLTQASTIRPIILIGHSLGGLIIKQASHDVFLAYTELTVSRL